ncbi:hypothetical protein KUCAC02_002510 [Chaenocephalus aceratus]|uniref:Uncharacterized protein n=1 Tax=Chaenocephalus aceratus TaxID=36190 RepID=A0ACB9XW75_CHAAC|nr:hypothetical protein KUCAC02_002510 [Chaenocephalus aceratus]
MKHELTIMSTLNEVDTSSVNGSDKEHSTQGEAVGEQTPQRRHADALLDLSEEVFMNELEPHEYHCYPGWEEAVHGWARVAPLSCILLNQKIYKKPKPKEAETLTPLHVDPTTPKADSPASIAEQHCESEEGLHDSFKKAVSLKQPKEYWINPAAAALQKDASDWPVPSAMQGPMSNLLHKEKTEKEGMLRETLQHHHLPSRYSENKHTKPQRHRHRPNNMVVPIKNFTFLPPIISQHQNPLKVTGQPCSGRKAPEGEIPEENVTMFDKKSGSRVDRIANPELPANSAALTTKYRTCQQKPHLFSSVSVSVPRRYQVPVSSKPDTVHSYSMGKSLTQALHPGTAGAHAHMHTGKTVCM